MIPSDHKWFRNFAVANIVVDALASLDLKLPASRINLAEIRRKYHAASKAERRVARHVS